MRGCVAILVCVSVLASSGNGGLESEHNIVPMPRRVAPEQGSFWLDANTALAMSNDADEEAHRIMENWSEPLRDRAKLPLPFSEARTFRAGVSGSGKEVIRIPRSNIKLNS